ncbi:MAG: 16S rRNA (guanine(527)-N(7))-methyltransferase RsmG [Firmicutes bacterium]|nr:16S rRNA (guanine(527)-N(7))-methyltransferase RsmG [Bacillota bacterium]
MTKEELYLELEKLGITLTDKQKEQLEIYKDFLIEYNKHTNLTRIIDENDIYLKHFYDSLTIVKYIDLSNKNTLLDIGTGAGFPGMVLKIVYPNLEVTLLDSNNKKITFLKQLSEKLNIKVNAIQARSEEYIKEKREYFDVVTSRAMANLRVLLELSIPYVKVNGNFIAMKANASEELKEANNTHEKLGAKLSSINEFELIKENSKRTIIVYDKISNTDTKYPRKYDIIIKKAI